MPAAVAVAEVTGRERETKSKDVAIESVPVVEPPTEDEFDAILRRMREAVKYFQKAKLPEPSREVGGV